ncbi:AsmA family protein [Gracilimonas halophila]|uniref:AsmA-like C-terminal region n=1 Tax=Gracilimonas halophila TaxID=1834464 RepID=A0ABW5JM83_9BACT
MKKVIKVLSIILAATLIIAVAAAFIIPIYLNEPLKEAFIEEFNQQTEQNYQLDFADIHVSLFRRAISVDSISVLPDSTSPHVQQISASSISVNGIRIWSLFSGSFPDFKAITVNEPHVEILERDLSSTLFSGNESDEALEDLDTFNLYINNGSGTIRTSDGNELFSISDISLEAEDVDINKLLDGSELLFMDHLLIQGAGIKWNVEKEFYDLTIANFNFDKQAESFSIANMALTPLLTKYEFSEAKGFQLDRINLEILALSLSGMNLNSLADEHINVEELSIDKPWMEVFRNKQIDRKEGLNVKPLLNELANSVDFSIGVNETIISEATIIYEEHKGPSDSSAAISFNDLDATISNIRSASHPSFLEDTLTLHVETLFMDTALLTVDVSYPVFNDADFHTVKANLDSFDPKVAGNMLERSGFVRVEEGLVESLEAEFELNSQSSSGEALILYRDLRISFLDEDSGEQGFGEKFKDLIANTFSIKSDNIEPDPSIGDIDFEREVEKSLFAYWWKSLLSGIQDTIK